MISCSPYSCFLRAITAILTQLLYNAAAIFGTPSLTVPSNCLSLSKQRWKISISKCLEELYTWRIILGTLTSSLPKNAIILSFPVLDNVETIPPVNSQIYILCNYLDIYLSPKRFDNSSCIKTLHFHILFRPSILYI